MSDEELWVVIVTARPDNQPNVLKTVAAYVTDEPCKAVELRKSAEKETGGVACVNCAPFVHVPDCACFVPMGVVE